MQNNKYSTQTLMTLLMQICAAPPLNRRTGHLRPGRDGRNLQGHLAGGPPGPMVVCRAAGRWAQRLEPSAEVFLFAKEADLD